MGELWGQGAQIRGGLQDTQSHLRDFGTLNQGVPPAPGEKGIHQLRLSHLLSHTSVFIRDGTAESDNGDIGGLC